MTRPLLVLACLCSFGSGQASAEVADSSSAGFTVKIQTAIKASPKDVYNGILQVSRWWDPAHTFSHDAKNLSMDERAMGCFCEKLANGGSVRHMEVIYLAPGEIIRLSGALGPMQAIAAVGTLTFRITPAESGSQLALTYSAFGYQPTGMVSWAAPVDGVLQQQVARLKAFLEGSSNSAPHPAP